METRVQVGTLKVTLNFRLMSVDRNIELMAPNDDEVILADKTLYGLRDQIAEKFVAADIHNFEIEVKA